jgi:Tat protein translocase TatB subunit
MDFLGIGMGEVVLILLLALLIFGPEKLPQIARTMGRISRQIKQVSSDFTREVTREVEDVEAVRKEISQATKDSLPKIEMPNLETDLAQMEKEIEGPPARAPQGKTGVEKDR